MKLTQVISPARGTLAFGTIERAAERAREISAEHPESFAKVVTPDGREWGFVDGQRASCVRGEWFPNGRPGQEKSDV